jgi:hypothetical protein
VAEQLPEGFNGVYRCTKHPDREVVAPVACNRCQECAEDIVNAYANAMVKHDQAQRHIGRQEHDLTTCGEPIDERKVRKRREELI